MGKIVLVITEGIANSPHLYIVPMGVMEEHTALVILEEPAMADREDVVGMTPILALMGAMVLAELICHPGKGKAIRRATSVNRLEIETQEAEDAQEAQTGPEGNLIINTEQALARMET